MRSQGVFQSLAEHVDNCQIGFYFISLEEAFMLQLQPSKQAFRRAIKRQNKVRFLKG